MSAAAAAAAAARDAAREENWASMHPGTGTDTDPNDDGGYINTGKWDWGTDDKKTVFTNAFDDPQHIKDYLDEFPESGQVHTEFGGEIHGSRGDPSNIKGIFKWENEQKKHVLSHRKEVRYDRYGIEEEHQHGLPGGYKHGWSTDDQAYIIPKKLMIRAYKEQFQSGIDKELHERWLEEKAAGAQAKQERHAAWLARKGPPAPERGGAVHEGRSKQELAAQLAAMTPPPSPRQVVPDETPGASHPHEVVHEQLHFYHEPVAYGGTHAEIFGHHTSSRPAAVKVI